jgi:hypothetical protein
MSKILKESHVFIHLVNDTHLHHCALQFLKIFIVGMYIYIQGMLCVVCAIYFEIDSTWYLIVSTEDDDDYDIATADSTTLQIIAYQLHFILNLTFCARCTCYACS